MQHSIPDDVDGIAEEGRALLDEHPEIRARFERIERSAAAGSYEPLEDAVVKDLLDRHQDRPEP